MQYCTLSPLFITVSTRQGSAGSVHISKYSEEVKTAPFYLSLGCWPELKTFLVLWASLLSKSAIPVRPCQICMPILLGILQKSTLKNPAKECCRDHIIQQISQKIYWWWERDSWKQETETEGAHNGRHFLKGVHAAFEGYH